MIGLNSKQTQIQTGSNGVWSGAGWHLSGGPCFGIVEASVKLYILNFVCVNVVCACAPISIILCKCAHFHHACE